MTLQKCLATALLAFMLFAIVLAVPTVAHAWYYDDYFGTVVVPDICEAYDWSYCSTLANLLNYASIEAGNYADNVENGANWNSHYLFYMDQKVFHNNSYYDDGGICAPYPESWDYSYRELTEWCWMEANVRSIAATGQMVAP